MDKQEQAEFLIEALPYIKKYYNKIIVIKYGGNAMTDGKLKFAVMNDVAVLNALGIKVVLVHGGGPEISDISKRMGIQTKFVNGLRYTDEETAEIARTLFIVHFLLIIVSQEFHILSDRTHRHNTEFYCRLKASVRSHSRRAASDRQNQAPAPVCFSEIQH